MTKPGGGLGAGAGSSFAAGWGNLCMMIIMRCCEARLRSTDPRPRLHRATMPFGGNMPVIMVRVLGRPIRPSALKCCSTIVGGTGRPDYGPGPVYANA